MQYLIVGPGPVGVVTAEYLLNQNKKVIKQIIYLNTPMKRYFQTIFIAIVKKQTIYQYHQQLKVVLQRFGEELLVSFETLILKIGI